MTANRTAKLQETVFVREKNVFKVKNQAYGRDIDTLCCNMTEEVLNLKDDFACIKIIHSKLSFKGSIRILFEKQKGCIFGMFAISKYGRAFMHSGQQKWIESLYHKLPLTLYVKVEKCNDSE